MQLENRSITTIQDRQFFGGGYNMDIWWEDLKSLVYNFDLAWHHYKKIQGLLQRIVKKNFFILQ